MTKDIDIKVAARSAANRRLREEFAARYRELLIEEHERVGATYRPRLTDEERAEQQVADLFTKFPALKTKYAVE